MCLPSQQAASPAKPWTAQFDEGHRDDLALSAISEGFSAQSLDGFHQTIVKDYGGAELVDLPAKLVHAYFTLVCPMFSTYDSQQNLFRSFIGQRWQNSSPMFYAMLSMAAGKLARQEKAMRLPALEYQSLAIRSLYNAVSNASGWDTELLFVILMLGLSTSWHNIKDLGLVHLKAMQHAISNNKVDCLDNSDTLEFFREALVYWEMVTCFISQDVSLHGYAQLIDNQRSAAAAAAGPTTLSAGGKRVKPHPWGSIASIPQGMFARAAQLIQEVRLFKDVTSIALQERLQPVEFSQKLNALEQELWNLRLLGLHEIANTGDPNTPAIHHLLVAEAYMLANFYQLYHVFPKLRRSRAARLVDECSSPDRAHKMSWAGIQSTCWASMLQMHGNVDEWLAFLGRSIIERLEQIQVTSGTLCIQPLLLLVGSMALSIDAGVKGGEEEREVLRLRQFILDRLAYFSVFYCSDQIHHVKLVVEEIFARLDAGAEVFWMDALKGMGVLTIIG